MNKFKQNFHIIRQVDTNCLASKPTLNGNKWPQKFGVLLFLFNGQDDLREYVRN